MGDYDYPALDMTEIFRMTEKRTKMEAQVIIDGAIPRTEQERVSRLLDFAGSELDRLYNKNTAMTFPSKLYMRFHELQDEYAIHVDEDGFEHWNALEDEVIELITDMLPTGWLCMLAEDDPGTVIVTEYEEDID